MALKQVSQYCHRLVAIVLVCALLFWSTLPCGAQQVTTSITQTLGTGDLGTKVTPAGTIHTITGGTRPGGGANLFHSFGQFSIAATDTANFFNNTGVTTSNILSRVTGGSRSNIFGTIQTTGFPGAQLFLMNPAGVVFGPTAQLNVEGSFHVTTANNIRMFDGTNSAYFHANPAKDSMANSVLSLAPLVDFGFLKPAAFGFTDETAPPPATITVQGSVLQVPPSQTLSLVGGNITIQSATLENGSLQSSKLIAPGGRIQLASVASTGEVVIRNTDGTPALDIDPSITRGQIEIRENSLLDVSPILFDAFGIPALDEFGNPIVVGDGAGGSVLIRARSLIVDGSAIQSENMGGVPGANPAIDLNASGSVNMTNGASILVFPSGLGRAGDVHIASPTIELSGGSIINSFSGVGPGGDIVLNTKTLTIREGSFLNSDAADSGAGGNIIIKGLPVQGTDLPAESVTVSGAGSLIISDTTFADRGSGGKVDIWARNVVLEEGGNLSSSTSGTGQGGAILIKTEMLSLSSLATILSSVPGNGVGGTVTVQGLEGVGKNADLVTISGSDGLGTQSGILSNSSGSGVPGDISINTKTFTLADGGVLKSGQFDRSAGNVTVTAAEAISLSTGSSISSAAHSTAAGHLRLSAPSINVDASSVQASAASSGRGGDIVVEAGSLSLVNGARLDSSTTGEGAGGTVSIRGLGGAGTHADLVSISGPGSGVFTNTEISVTNNTLARGGVINITAGQVQLTNGSSIQASTIGSGRGGDIVMEAGSVSLVNGAHLDSSTSGAGAGGTVTIRGLGGAGTHADLVAISGPGSGLFTTTTGSGAGGSIQIVAGQTQVETLANVSAATFGKGNAGNISVSGASLSVMSGGRVETSTSAQGTGGTINITTTGDVTISGVSADGQTRSGIFAKTQTSGSGSGGGSGGGGSGSGSGGEGGVPSATAGDAGDINVTGKNLLVDRGAQIDSSTTSGGAGGGVSVTAAEGITIVGTGTRLTSDASRGDGPGGNLVLQAQNITVSDKASVTAATGGKGDAGSIAMTAQDTLLLESGGTITTSTRGAGKGGTILITANQLILDGPGSSITADTLRPFADLGVTLEILHTNDGDLVAQIDSPAGTRVALFSRVGGNGDNFTGTTLDDHAATPITASTAPFAGTFQPREPLGQLIDQPATGVWTLNIRDSATGNTGQLKDWSIRIGDQVFQSANVPATIPDNGALQSAVTVAGPAGARIQGIGEISGIGGDITIQAGTVTIQNGATMSATSRGSGKGGTLHVNATGPVILTGANSGLFTDAEASGPGGSINVQAAVRV